MLVFSTPLLVHDPSDAACLCYAIHAQPVPRSTAAQAHLLPVCVIWRRRRYDPPRCNPIEIPALLCWRDDGLTA